MSEVPILTTPPVHDAGPDIGQKEIKGGEASRTGFDSRMRDALERMTDEVAARHTNMPIVVPVKEILETVRAVLPDLPRIPDYDHTSAALARWTEASEYNRYAVPDADPDSLGVFVRDQGADIGKVCIELARPGDDTTATLDFDPDYIESFGLAVLAACAYARTRR